MMNKYKKITLDGIIFNNPTFILVLGTCPTLGLISSALSALEMGLAVIVVLTLSNMIISALRGGLPSVYEALGGFLALIVVNCIILGRAEAFANKHTVAESAVDGLANGAGFTIALTVMGVICEFLGKGSLFGLKIMEFSIGLFGTPAGSFIVFGLSICAFTAIIDKFLRAKRVKANRLARENLLGAAQSSVPAEKEVKA